MPLGIDPTVDYAFKKLFGDPANSDLLIHLLNAVLKSDSPIVQVELLNPFNEKEFAEDKLSVVDVKARDSLGNWYNVEMQSRAQPVLRRRLPYYNALLFAGQLSEGEGYEWLATTVTVCFLEEVLFPGVKSPHLSFTFCDCQQKVQLSDCVQIHTIELPKYNFDERLIGQADPLEQWAFFMSRAAVLEAAELKRLLPDSAYTKATGVMEMIGSTPQQREFYEARLKAERDHHMHTVLAVQEAVQEAVQVARQEALQEGRQEGQILGRQEGLVEQVRLLQRVLHEPEMTESELIALGFDSLKRLSDDLKARLLAQ